MATDIRIKYSIDTEDIVKAQVAFDKLTQEEQDALNKLKLFNEGLGDTGDEAEEARRKLKELGASDSLNVLKKKAELLRSEIAKLSPATDEFKRKAKELKSVEKDLAGVNKAASGAGNGLQGLLGKLGPLGPAVAGAFSVGAVVAFGQQALAVAGRFQTLEAVLRNTLGSDSAAQGALLRIKEIAATTPFSVEELTQSFVKLANQGFKPTNQQIIALGDLAASTGKSFDQLAEALIDAQTGEFERLKEFGIRASKSGDQVKFTFKGVETTVRNTSKAIQDYVISLGSIEGVANSMGAQSATLEGSVSNLGDAWDAFLLSIGESLGPIYQKAVQVTAAFLVTLKDLFQSDESKRKEAAGKAYNDYSKQLEKTSEQGLINLEENSAREIEIAKKKVDELVALKNDESDAINEAAMLAGNQAGIIRTKRDETFLANSLKAEQNRLSKLEAKNKAAHDMLLKRLDERKAAEADAAKAKEAADKEQEKADKKAEAAAQKREQAIAKEYKAKKDAIELEQKLQEERIKQSVAPEGQDMARKELEMATNLELLNLAKEYDKKKVAEATASAKLLPAIIETQNKEITDNYKKEGDASTAAFIKGLIEKQIAAEDAAKKLNEANLTEIDKKASSKAADLELEGAKMKEITNDFRKTQVQNQIDANNERIAENERAYAAGVITARDANDEIINENKRLQAQLIAIDKDTAKQKQEIMLAGVDLAAQITSQSFALYQANLSAEMDGLQKKYDEEIRLADGNKQKITELNEKKAAEEKEIKKKQFFAQRYAAIAQVVFNTAPIIAQYGAAVFTAPLALIALAAQAAQIGFILAQPVPEFAEGTKGRKFRGGRAMVGEKGTEKIVTESGKVYFTPPTATLMDLPKGSQVIPNHLLSKQEINYASMSRTAQSNSSFDLGGKLTEIGGILKGLPIHQIVMDEKGFQKFIKSENRTTKVLNNKFPQAYS